MSCYKPLLGYRALNKNESGKRSLVFSVKTPRYDDTPVFVPCGHCVGCRLDRSREWALRCMHESQYHDVAYFVTLTYNDDNLPSDGSLRPDDFTLFMKRLRKSREPGKLAYFMCGEYGDNLSRPHYHAILFGAQFEDKRKWKRTPHGVLFKSAELEDIWGHGYCSLGPVNFTTCAYVSRYVMKKVYGEKADEFYGGKVPEYIRMSLKPAIGKRWYETFGKGAHVFDHVIMNGRKHKVPKYYDKLLERVDEDEFLEIKRERKARMMEPEVLANSSPVRLAIREEVKDAAVSILSRNMEPLK